jgi:hypothetical protein
MLAQMLTSLSADKLKEMQDAITTAGITREFKGDHRAIFKRLRSQSTGRAKKIYSCPIQEQQRGNGKNE